MSSTKQPTILETIYAQRAKDVEAAKSTPGTSPQDLTTLLSLHLAPPLIPLVQRLKRNPSSSQPTPSPSLMAEIKRASPSKGPIALSANAAHQALIYALSGASVISVLTEPSWFKGSLLDMRLARQAVDTLPDRPAILRKEFILDEYQIAEARLWGADTVLLIVAMLSPERLKELYQYSLSLGMEPLVEVNNTREMELAIELGSKVIGVNNRNLHDFNVDMGTTSRLAELVQDRDVILCALSGISGPTDVRTYKEQGVRAVLVGEALMRAKDTGKFIRELLEWPELQEANESKEKIWVKVTGVRTVDEVTALTSAGVDILTFVFDSSSKFFIPTEQVASITSTIRASRLPPAISVSSVSVPTQQTPWFTSHVQALTAASPRPLIVGAFSSEHHTLRDIQHAVAIAQLDAVQVNEGTPAGWISHIPVPVIRRTAATNSEPGIVVGTDIAHPGLHQFALLDLVGEESKWDVAKTVIEVEEAPGWVMPLILRSQKLTASNAAEVVQTVKPWAVDVDIDVSGGVEALVDAVKGDVLRASKRTT